MIIVNVEIVLAEDVIKNYREAFRIMDLTTRSEEGCITYVSSIDVNDPKIIRIFEIWESMEALIPHFQTPRECPSFCV